MRNDRAELKGHTEQNHAEDDAESRKQIVEKVTYGKTVEKNMIHNAVNQYGSKHKHLRLE